MRKNFKNERNLRRAGDRQHNESALKLQSNIEKFFEDCIGKTDAQVLELYAWYNKKWKDYAVYKNGVTNSFKVFEDAFEDTMKNLHKTLRKVDPNTVSFEMPVALHVCEIFREKTRLERFYLAIERLFERLFKKRKEAVVLPMEKEEEEPKGLSVVK